MFEIKINKMDDDIKAPLITKKTKNEEEENIKGSSNKFSEDKNDIENEDEDENENELSNLLEKKVDKKILLENYLISKIYFVFFLQLSITFLFIYYAFNNEIFHDALKKNIKIFYFTIIITAIIFFSSYKWREVVSIVPFNYFFFLIFTISISYIICKIVILFQFKTIAVLWSLTLLMVLSLSTYAYNSKKQIKIAEAAIFSSLILISFSIIIKFVSKIPFADILLILLFLISLVVYLVYDVRSLINSFKIGNKNYILVDILLYIDIFRLLMKLVNFIIKHLSSKLDKEDAGVLNDLKELNDDIEKGFKEVKNFTEKDNEDGNDEKDDENDADDDDDDSDDNKKGKEKKGKKDDKGKGKKSDKEKKGKKEDKKEKGKKEDKKEKGKKEDKKEKGKKEKSKKDDKKDSKKGKDGKNKKSKKKNDDDDEEDSLFNEDNIKNIGDNIGGYMADTCSHQ